MSDNNKHFLDHPAVTHHLNNIFPVIVEESDRGAVLMAASQLDVVLGDALKKIAPKDMSNNQMKPLFNFLGPLGTFSAKINMAYYFRIINKDVCIALHSLRGLRNTVAHECTSFSLDNYSEELEKYYKIGPGVPVALNNWAVDFLMKNAIENCLNLSNPTIEEDRKLFNEPAEVIEHIRNHPELLKLLENKLPKWKLGLGTALLSGITHYGAEKAVQILGDNATFSSIKI